MTSGPYQSSLLRFAIAQYRQGLARHRVAVRTARSTAVMGVAVTLLPVYAVVNASVNASQWIGQSFKRSWKQSKLPGTSAKAANLLNLTDFEESCLSVPTSVALEVPASSPDQMMIQTLLTVGSALSSAQVDLLSPNQGPKGVSQWISRVFDRIRPLGKGHEIAVSEKITGVASDLETRSLVLIKGYSVVWNGLSAAQQANLQQKMAWLLARESAGSAQSLPSENSLAFRQKSSLAHSVRSFWVEVLRVMAWLCRAHPPAKVSQLPEGTVQLPSARLPKEPPKEFLSLGKAAAVSGLLPNISSTATSKAISMVSSTATTIRQTRVLSTRQDSVAVLTSVSLSERLAALNGNSEGADYLETDVIAFDYIEHPLETLLKWVDRICLWLEDRWRAFQDWVLRFLRKA